jgi:hypothetical protein
MYKLHYALCVRSKELIERVHLVKNLKPSNIEKITCIDDIENFIQPSTLVVATCDTLINVYNKTLKYKFISNFFWGLYFATLAEVDDFEKLIDNSFSPEEIKLLKKLVDFKKTNSLFLGIFSIFKPLPVS